MTPSSFLKIISNNADFVLKGNGSPLGGEGEGGLDPIFRQVKKETIQHPSPTQSFDKKLTVTKRNN